MYCWGSGRIGHGSALSDIKIPKPLYFNTSNNEEVNIFSEEEETEVKGEKDIEFIDFCAGRAHSLAIDNKNRCWVFGENSSAELGNNSLVYSKIPILNKQLENEKIVSVSCWNQSYAITDQGKVWEWGKSTDILVPRLLNFKHSIKAIDCSLNNSIAVSHNGIAFIGFNDNNSSTNEPRPVEYFIENKIEIQSVACGINHYLYLTNRGEVYSNGKGISTGHYDEIYNNSNNNKNNGDSSAIDIKEKEEKEEKEEEEEEEINIIIPKKLEQLRNIIEISSGYYNSLALDGYQNQVYGWGENLNGQLGIEGIEYSTEPILIELPLVEIKHISSGAYHSAFLTNNGELIVMGGGLVVSDDFRMSVALGNGDGGFQTIQFKVDTTKDETIISENIKFNKPTSQLINVEIKDKNENNKEQNKNDDGKEDEDEDIDKENQETNDKGILTEEEMLEFQYHFNELSHYDNARNQFSPQFIESLKNKVVVDKVSCGKFHTLATVSKTQLIPPIESLQQYCIKYISENIINNMETDTSFPDINTLPINTVLKIDSHLTLNRKHTDRSQRLMSYLKSTFKQNIYNNNNNSNNSSSISNTINSPKSTEYQWDQYLEHYSKEFEANAIVTLKNTEILTKTKGFEISVETVCAIINGFMEFKYVEQYSTQVIDNKNENQINNNITNDNEENENENESSFSNYKIKIPGYQDFVIISLTNDKIAAINKKYTILIDKTNLLLVISIFKRSLLLTNPYILKEFENIVLDLKINGY
ncbi:hypothetical protein ACTFIU_006680 [Dictyostelium citrinum]